jgi:hypothetical protein
MGSPNLSSYAHSSFGWDPPSKKRELFHQLGRFILVRAGQGSEAPVVAFATFRFEHEEDERVVYWYVKQNILKLWLIGHKVTKFRLRKIFTDTG